MANNTSIKDLVNNSIQVYPGMIVVWPHLKKEEAINFDVATFNGRYSSNNGTLAFVIDNTLYVTPSTRNAYKALMENDFIEKSFYVPFSNGDYPKKEEEMWLELRAKGLKSYENDFVEDCARYCDKHGIGTLDADILANCFVIPQTGVRVKHPYFEDTYYPVISNSHINLLVVERLGIFAKNNGKVVFVYRDGKTYVTKGYKILDTLREAGYKETEIFVPFSNGEVILDPVLRARWEFITK